MDNNERITKIETKMDEYERRLSIQEDKNEKLAELSTYVKLQYEHNKKQDEKLDKMEQRFEKMTEVLDGINTNLLSLNHDVKHMKDKQDDIDNRVGGLEEEQRESRKQFVNRTISFRLKVIAGVIIGVTVAAITFYFGLK